MIAQMGLLDYVYESFNDGVDIFRSGFTPENAFAAMHNILSMLSQPLSDCKPEHRTECMYVCSPIMETFV